MISTLDARDAKNVGPIPNVGAIFPIFTTPMTLIAMAMILYKLCNMAVEI